MLKTYLFLVGAIICEVCGTMLLPVTQNFTKVTPTVFLAGFYLTAFYLLTFVVDKLPIGLIALKAGVSKDNETISKECVKMGRDKVGPVAAFKIAIVVKRLPKTRSGKVLRGTIRKIADKEEYKMPATIDDPAILDEIKEDLINSNILK